MLSCQRNIADLIQLSTLLNRHSIRAFFLYTLFSTLLYAYQKKDGNYLHLPSYTCRRVTSDKPTQLIC